MKYEIADTRPPHFQEDWPGQYDVFSHLEFACGIPQLIFAVSTLKGNGKPNVCLQSWSSFFGDATGYYVSLGGLLRRTHTYENILRDGAFCVNFLPCDRYDALSRSIRENGEDADEFEICGLHAEKSVTISVPRIQEAFLSLECVLHRTVDLSADGATALLVGRVTHAAVSEAYATGIDEKYGPGGFFFSVHSPVDYASGQCAPFALATLHVDRTL